MKGGMWVRSFPLEITGNESNQLSPREEQKQFPTGLNIGRICYLHNTMLVSVSWQEHSVHMIR